MFCNRCLINYFYDQLDLLKTDDRDDSIFTPRDDGKGYKLKEGLEFHLYINTAPCGDARIFSPHEDGDAVDRHPNRSSRGQLRTKIETGEGTVLIRSKNSVQTWDGIMQVGKAHFTTLAFRPLIYLFALFTVT